MRGDAIDDQPVMVISPDVHDEEILPERIYVPHPTKGHPFLARPPDISEKDWLSFGLSQVGTNARRALADEYDRKRQQSIRDAQLRSAARADTRGSESADRAPAAACEASDREHSSGLTDIFDFISLPNTTTPRANSLSLIETQRLSRPHHISPELWAAAAPAQRMTEHNISNTHVYITCPRN